MTRVPTLTKRQMQAIHLAMQTFVDDDLQRGVSPEKQGYCHACRGPRPLPGFIDYGRAQLCAPCATEYEVACARGLVTSPHAFVRDKTFGEESRYQIPHPDWHETAPGTMRASRGVAKSAALPAVSPNTRRSIVALPDRPARTSHAQ